jgi:hypothetical protein
MAQTVYLIPLQATNQTFTISLAGVTYTITIVWNYIINTWILNIGDSSNTPIVSGIPLVTGTDLLRPFPYLNFGGQLIVQTTNDTTAIPTYDNLGTSGNLYFVVTS